MPTLGESALGSNLESFKRYFKNKIESLLILVVLIVRT